MLYRLVEKEIEEYLKSETHKILFVWGPRRSGKTTLLEKLSRQFDVPIFNFDLISDREVFIAKEEILKKLAQEHKLILIDEVQNYPESTVPLKILHDRFKIKIIATGSSELRKKSQAFDTLTGRFIERFCLPLSAEEVRLNEKVKKYEEEAFFKNLAEKIQIFGTYPEIYTLKEQEQAKIELLANITDTYVVKDIVDIYQLKNVKLAKNILTKIALQIGSEVSLREIASSLDTNVTTVANYVEIFVKNYVLIPLPAFKVNIRRAISEHRKFFFFDLGIRNALVKDFRELEFRPDKGGLFENFVISEIEKLIKNHKLNLNMYFYREYGGKEVDLVLEDYKKNYLCLEVKHKRKKSQKVFPFKHQIEVATPANYYEVVEKIRKFAS